MMIYARWACYHDNLAYESLSRSRKTKDSDYAYNRRVRDLNNTQGLEVSKLSLCRRSSTVTWRDVS